MRPLSIVVELFKGRVCFASDLGGPGLHTLTADQWTVEDFRVAQE